jgi:hypothetical protein
MNWLETLLKQHDEFESPKSFWYWGALAAISAVMKDQVWLDQQLYKVYPNIYVMFHADSGLKKGPPVGMAKKLVNLVGNTHVISGRSSIQGILKELGGAQTQPGGKVVTKSTAFICSSELSSSIVEDKVATTILTDLYDRVYNEGEWKSLLKMESFKLMSPTITMLTATNEAHSTDFFSGKDIRGGYFARTFIIHEDKRHTVNSLAGRVTNRPDYDKLSLYLKELAKLKGEFLPLSSWEQSEYYSIEKEYRGRKFYFSEVGQMYDAWYTNFIESMTSTKIKDPTGTLNRFGDSVLKVAMLVSLAQDPKLEITPSALMEAIDHCETLVGNIRKTTFGKEGKSVWAEQKLLLIQELLTRETHSISKEQLNRKYWMHANSKEWDDIANSMVDGNMIRIDMMGGKIVYTMPEEQVKDMLLYLKGKKHD